MSDEDNVIQFRRRGERPQAATATASHPGDASLHRRTRQAAPGARRLAAEQTAAERAKYTKAATRQRVEELLATGRPVPARISIALDSGGHEGPEVDLAVGTHERNPAGDVDVWECGLASPTGDQVKLLAELTGFPIPWFYEPFEPGPLLGNTAKIIICYRRKVNGRKCHFVDQSHVDENGVLHYGGEPPRTPPKWWTDGQGALF